MILGIPFDQVIWLVAGLLGAGAVTGLLAGLFGVGGGAVIVPVLYELFGVLGVPVAIRMPLCVGTSLAIIIPTSIASFRTHYAKGAVNPEVLKAWALPVLAGVILGSAVAGFAGPTVFKLVFCVVAGLNATKLISGINFNFGTVLPGFWTLAGFGFVIGVLSALMGIGGGVLGVMVLTGYGMAIHPAIATSSGLGVLISIPGTIGYIIAGWPQAALNPGIPALQVPLALGFVSLIGFALFVPTSMLLAPVGARLAHRLTKRTLEISFGLFLLAVSARFLWDLVIRG